VVYELSTVAACAADGAGGDALCPLVAEFRVMRAVPSLSTVAAQGVTGGLVLAPAGVAAAGCVAGQRGAVRRPRNLGRDKELTSFSPESQQAASRRHDRCGSV
jgi:hypothetical protein